MKVLFKVDVTNENKVISKDHGLVVKAGTELDFDPVPERVKQFIKMGICAAAESSQETDPEPPADPEGKGEDQDDQEPGELPDDLEELKAKADELGVEYAANIGAKKLKERIQQHLEK